MIQCFNTDASGTHAVDSPVPGCWVSVVAPTEQERAWLRDEVGVVDEFVAASLDDEERARVDHDDDTRQTLVIVDCPFVEDAASTKSPDIVQYDTHPLSLLFLPDKDMLVTVTLRENPTIAGLATKRLPTVNTNQRTRLLLRVLLDVSQRYLAYLRSVNVQFTKAEHELRRDMDNAGLMRMLGFQNSLVYFGVSLKADEAMLQRVRRGHVLPLYEDDDDLLDDVSVEFRQAIEMCTVYADILEGTMDTYGNLISNNVNNVMRRLTLVTLVMALPTMVFSFYGMNVDDLPGDWSWLVPVGMSAVLVVVALLVVRYTKWLR